MAGPGELPFTSREARSSNLIYRTLIVLAWVFGAGNLALCVEQILRPMPRDLWEPGLMLDGVRHQRGLPVYESEIEGHATWMYGPLTILFTGHAYQWLPVLPQVSRLWSFACSIGAIGILLWATRPQRQSLEWHETGALVGLCWMGHFLSGSVFTLSRPDMAASLFALIFVVGSIRGLTRRRLGEFLLAHLALIAAIEFKQTAAAVAIVPVIGVLIQPGNFAWRWRWITLASPLVPVVLMLLHQQLWPDSFHYMFWIPSQYAIQLSWPKLLHVIVCLLPFGLFVCLRIKDADEATRGLMKWIVATAFPVSLLVAAAYLKRGGGQNLLLPLWWLSCAMITCRFEQVRHRIRSPDSRGAWYAAGVAFVFGLPVLVMLPENLLTAWFVNNGGNARNRVVEYCGELPGRVLCPADPHLVYLANGSLERNLGNEIDASLWPAHPPSHIVADWAHADWIIQIESLWGPTMTESWLNPEILGQLGFEDVERLAGESYPSYVVWRRVKQEEGR